MAIGQSTERALTVGAIMSTGVQAIEVNARLSDALRLMAEDNYSAIPVLNSEQQCVGILTRSDLTETLFAEDRILDQFKNEAFINVSLESCSDRFVREAMSDCLQRFHRNPPSSTLVL